MIVADLQNSYGSLFKAREQFLMKLAGWPQMDDHTWIQSLAVSTCALRLHQGDSFVAHGCVYSYSQHVPCMLYLHNYLCSFPTSYILFCVLLPKTAPLSSLSSVELQNPNLTILDVDIAGQQGTLLASLVVSANKNVLRAVNNVIVAHCYAFQCRRIDCDQLRSNINEQLTAGCFSHEDPLWQKRPAIRLILLRM